MGYSTEFKGKLKFVVDLTSDQLEKVGSFLGEDCRDHPEWLESSNLTHVDLCLLSDLSGIEWDGSEKTYDLVEKINMIIINMKSDVPDFNLVGSMVAQGDEFNDRWEIIASGSGMVEHKELPISGEKVTCPHCEESFRV